MHPSSKFLLIALLAAFLLSACGLTDLLPTRAPTATFTPVPPPTLTPTPTRPPTATPAPTPIPVENLAAGQRAILHGDWETAVRRFEAVLADAPEPDVASAAQLGLGRAYLLARNSYLAAAALEAVIANYPEQPDASAAHFLLARLYDADGRPDQAAAAYLAYLTLRPGVLDGYVFEWRGDALFAAGDYLGAAGDYRAALQSPSLSDGLYLQLKLARATSVGGDSDTALALYDDVFARTSDDFTKALVLLRKGQTYLARGDSEAAYDAFRDAVYDYPKSYDAYSALLALVEAGLPVDELQRGLVDYYAREYGVALAAFDRYLQNNPQEPDVALYYSGMSQQALGNATAALASFERLIASFPESRFWDDAWDEKAFVQWYELDQYTRAADTLVAFADANPAHPRAGEFLFSAAQIAERANELPRAADLWLRVGDQYPGYGEAPRAFFLSGVTAYRLQDYGSGLIAFQRALAVAPLPSDKAAAYLWMGKCYRALGDEASTQKSFEQAASVDPTGYYSERARDLLRGQAPFAPPTDWEMALDVPRERARAESWLRETFALPEDADLAGLGELAADPAMLRGAELWRLGMLAEARDEFEGMRTRFENDPVSLYRLMNYFQELGVYRSAVFAARQILTLAGLSDADTLSAPAYFNHNRFPTPFAEMILPLAEEHDFHPLFVWSVVRQESLFESFVRSSAAAHGLMQVIPATGADLAANLGWPKDYANEDLYRPLVSLTLGTEYLERQRRAFGGDLYAALAAYNGGPGNSRAWLNLANGDQDLFLETIRYGETRNYIRGIYEIFNLYRRIYGHTP